MNAHRVKKISSVVLMICAIVLIFVFFSDHFKLLPIDIRSILYLLVVFILLSFASLVFYYQFPSERTTIKENENLDKRKAEIEAYDKEINFLNKPIDVFLSRLDIFLKIILTLLGSYLALTQYRENSYNNERAKALKRYEVEIDLIKQVWADFKKCGCIDSSDKCSIAALNSSYILLNSHYNTFKDDYVNDMNLIGIDTNNRPTKQFLNNYNTCIISTNTSQAAKEKAKAEADSIVNNRDSKSNNEKAQQKDEETISSKVSQNSESVKVAIEATKSITEKNLIDLKKQSENIPSYTLCKEGNPIKWCKEGYYLNFCNAIQVAVKRIDKKSESAVIVIDEERKEVEMKVGTEHDFDIYKVKLLRIDRAGKNPFNWAAYFSVSEKNK